MQLNIPAYFAPEEYNDFKNCLHNEKGDYFVIENHSGIGGTGGINYFMQERKARISWDMIYPKQQGTGIGSELLQYRLQYLKKCIKDYWADGFDLYDMEKEHIPLQV